jgi:hypothetical protein
MNSRRIFQIALLAASSLIAIFTFGAAPAFAVQHLPLETFGSAEQPTFGAVKAVAVDQATGDVLVADGATNSILRYHADGTQDPFSSLGSNEIVAAGSENLTFGQAANETQIAVDNSKNGPASGDIYVTQAEQKLAYVFASNGEFLGQISEAFGSERPEPLSELPETLGEEICGVTVDQSGNVYLAGFGGKLHKYAPSANPPSVIDNTANFNLSSGSVHNICNIAAGRGSSSGKLFAVEYFHGSPVIAIDAASGAMQFPLTASSNGNISIDPSGGHVYVDSGEEVDEYAGGGATQPISSIPTPSSVQALAVDGGNRAVYVARAASPTLELSPAGPLVPGVSDQSVRGAVTNETTVEATINPEGTATSYFVEYGPTATYGSASSIAALPPDNDDHRVSVRLSGLSAGTEYHFRFSATNAAGTSLGVDRTLSTFRARSEGEGCPNSLFRGGPAARLLDCRGYEMVTPVDKNNTDIVGLINVRGNEAVLDQSALSGERLTYTTSQAFGDTQGAPYVSQYIAGRGEDGWSSSSIAPPQGVSRQVPGNRLDLEYQLFSPDLCQGLLLHYTEPSLAPGAQEGIANVYRRMLCEGSAYETLAARPQEEVPVPAAGNVLNIQGLSADGRCGLVSIPRNVEPELLPGELLENCDGHIVSVGILPDGEPATEPVAGTTNNESKGIPELALRAGNNQGAISENGSRVYFSPKAGNTPIYLRENPQAGRENECTEPSAACTTLVSEHEEGSIFWGASPDGAHAFYSTQSGGLYEFDADAKTSMPIAGEVAGVMGVDQEGNRIYFASTEVLDSRAIAGKPNLYLYEDAGAAPRYRFIGVLTKADATLATFVQLSTVNELPSRRLARVSPDGLHAVFAAYAPLTGYDNTDRVSGKADLEVFRYDATADGGDGSLLCVSCNPSGQPPAGRDVRIEHPVETPGLAENWAAALIPPYETSFYGSRVISSSGDRVFFDSYEALVPSDTNGKEDVYEWEAPGSGGPAGGGCTAASSSFSPRNGGCLSLISSGESSSDSEFVDASPDGRDVFFSTASSLVPQDPGLIDIYDAREGGGFPPSQGRAPACEGEACQGPVAPPNDLTPSSASFKGPGNVVECAKGKVKKNGRCVAKKPNKKKHHKKKMHHKKKQNKKGGEGRANGNRRSGR